MMQPQSPPKPRAALRTALLKELAHWSTLPRSTLCWFLLLTIVLLLIDPLVPPVAYALQRWAGSSWNWRDRWASIRIWAAPGGWFVAILVTFSLLADAHVWFFAALFVLAQQAWRQTLPGVLSLSLLVRGSLYARLLLFFPLTPAVTLLYERIDPRTRVYLRRVLTPSDIPPPAPPETPAPPATSSTAATPLTPSPLPEKKKRSRSTRAKTTSTSGAEQLTIDSIVESEQAQTESNPPATRTTTHKKKKHPEDQISPPSLPESGQPETIDWAE